MYCEKCGQENRNQAKLCEKCGAPLKVISEQLMPFDLKEYISKVKNLEISLYEQEVLCYNLKAQISYLQEPGQYKQEPAAESSDEGVMAAVVLMIAGAIIGVIGFFIFVILYNSSGWTFPVIDSIFPSLFGGVGLGLIVYFIIWLRGQKELREKNREIAQQNKEIILENQKILETADKQLKMIMLQLKKAEQLYIQTQSTLEQYYNKGVIFEKYRSIVPVCMFYEYILSGRCDKLEGHEGAYNIYENELRMNLILGKLDEIIERLDRIEANQYIIANAIKEANNQVSQLCSSILTDLQKLDNIEKNTNLAAYYSKISAVNTTYLAWLNK